MPGFGDIVKKAFYLGVGLASYAGEKAGGTVAEMRSQVQKLADEMVARGEMTTEEGRRFVEDMMRQAQQPPTSDATVEKKPSSEPRRIEILEEEDKPTTEKQTPNENIDNLRTQVVELQEELKRLQRDQS
ncbi:phasin family protein [Aetokthonos hydrillicola Thurmond2011]|jgi:polyhydroxyalkanoate synthesis regulator phasin|uniref:Phasin family protein n=1 Tax=Aetokthonos hydrillicola Thurmond2011 TaxID=2712845 RepID=A0AAP5MAE5_9CYAN|nr:phasin family protein [Aetokthonos hydrillicola]MBO3458877.1 phasin family protein [Aetokthonos hydrillicola CCALA 1050]MBW4587275.1 phasin family protein [Aetokthonos hydrillicola CCALA 1050]MDR9896702.1 phasin family protein [Aetokthonos hydrillicola Thurmond2011]